MPSLTYWSQLQPSARVNSIAESLAAQVRDPAWMLCRQWQLGEFNGADAGSTAFTRITSRSARLERVQMGTSAMALVSGQLLEPLVEAEPISADLPTLVEIGQSFEELTTPPIRDAFRKQYPVPGADASDPAATRFLAVCSGHAVDGVALYVAAKQAEQANAVLPPIATLDPSLQNAAKQAVAAFVRWVETTWGTLGAGEPPAWNATRLEYSIEVNAGGLTLSGSPDGDATLDWYGFDLLNGTPQPGPAATTSVIPGHVRFRGMPNARWWDFETSQTDFGAILPDSRDLSKLLFADFLLLHGDDWFVAPLDVPAGSLCWIDELAVTDVFGVVTEISRADATSGPRWTLFSHSDRSSGGLAPFLMVPSGAASVEGDAVEEVHLLRDETADMAWAIETVVEGPTGVSRLQPLPPDVAPPPSLPAPSWYQLITPMPSNWFPLMPVQTPAGAIAQAAGTLEGVVPAPIGRIVQRRSSPGFLLPEEEIGRAGVRLQRVACRSRSSDGSMHFWIARRKQVGAGEASSGLRFDQLRSAEPQ
jgi:hypothetical protein